MSRRVQHPDSDYNSMIRGDLPRSPYSGSNGSGSSFDITDTVFNYPSDSSSSDEDVPRITQHINRIHHISPVQPSNIPVPLLGYGQDFAFRENGREYDCQLVKQQTSNTGIKEYVIKIRDIRKTFFLNQIPKLFELTRIYGDRFVREDGEDILVTVNAPNFDIYIRAMNNNRTFTTDIGLPSVKIKAKGLRRKTNYKRNRKKRTKRMKSSRRRRQTRKTKRRRRQRRY